MQLKTISIAQHERVFLVLGIQNAMRMHHIFTGVLPLSTLCCHIISRTARFKKKVERQMCFDFLYKFGPKQFSF
jgi:hypothetical protein